MFVAVCDDDANILGELEQFMLQYTLTGHPSRVKTFQSGEALLLEYNAGNSPCDRMPLCSAVPTREVSVGVERTKPQWYSAFPWIMPAALDICMQRL
mgnify:CR=1 FL=1